MPVPPLRDLLGQPAVSAFLRGIVSRGRYGNAYLFHGPAGVGKGTAALAFARAALCSRVPGAAPEAERAGDAPGLLADLEVAGAARSAAGAPGDDACGECASCLKAGSLQHPDLRFLFPVSGIRSIDLSVSHRSAGRGAWIGAGYGALLGASVTAVFLVGPSGPSSDGWLSPAAGALITGVPLTALSTAIGAIVFSRRQDKWRRVPLDSLRTSR